MSDKRKSYAVNSIPTIAKLIYKVLKKLFEQNSGRGTGVTRKESFADEKYRQAKEANLNFQEVRNRLKQILNDQKNTTLDNMANELSRLHYDEKKTMEQSVKAFMGNDAMVRQIYSIPVMREIFTPSFLNNIPRDGEIDDGDGEDSNERYGEEKERKERQRRELEEREKFLREEEAKLKKEQESLISEQKRAEAIEEQIRARREEEEQNDYEIRRLQEQEEKRLQEVKRLQQLKRKKGEAGRTRLWGRALDSKKKKKKKKNETTIQKSSTEDIQPSPEDLQPEIQTQFLQNISRNMTAPTTTTQQGMLTPAQLDILDKNRQKRIKKFAPKSQEKKTTADRVTERVTEQLLPELKGVRQNITNYDIRRQEAETQATEQRNLLLQRQEESNKRLDIKLNEVKAIFGQLQPQVDRVRRAIENKRPEQKEAKRILSDSQIRETINAIPSEYRGLLGSSVNQMLSGTFDLETIGVGMVGLATFMATGSPLVSQLTEPITRYLFNAFDINLNDYLYEPPQPITVYDSEVKRQLGTTTTEPSTETKPEQKQELGVLSDYNTLQTDFVPYEEFFSESDTEEFLNNLTDVLTSNVATELKIPTQAQQIIQSEARNYIRGEFSRFISAIRQQITRRDTTLYDLLQFNDEVVTPLGFFDYLNNLRGLPDAVRRNLPSVGIQDLREAMPVMMDIKRSIPQLPQLPMPERFRPGLPSRDELREGAAAGIGGGVVPGIIRGGAMGGVGGIISGGLGGVATAALISPMIRRYYEQQGLDMNDPEVKRNIQKLQALPPTVAGALLGYTGAGEGVLSGAGITERKITVDPSVLEETKAVDQQEGKEPKKWITKAIMPTPDILDETRQDKFVSDLEYSMFNYIEPGSEGANGNLKTNPLKRSQFLSDQLRYMDAGISTPNMLYNVEFPTNTPQKQMETYKLGQDMLPEMEFLVDDNSDTFTPIGRHYVNNNDTAVEMFSPFANYSDVRNYWAINRKSDLYNLYA